MLKHLTLCTVFAASVPLSGCSLQNTSTPILPTSPGGVPGGTSTTGSSTASAAFAGTWASSSLGGLPIGNCADLKWTLTAQTATTVAGTVAATCSNGAIVAATVSGQLQSENTMTMNASGTVTMSGLPCSFNLIGTGVRQGDDSMKVDYVGTYCLGNLSGSEVLRRFPNL